LHHEFLFSKEEKITYFLDSGVSHNPFHKVSKSQSSYTQILIHFVVFLLRDKGDYPLLLPPDVDALIEAFAQTPLLSQLLPPLFGNGGNLYCIRLVEILMKI